MAVIPSLLYPTQIISSDLGWPWGRAQNDGTPGDGAGTPLEAAWVSDLFGWEQALLTEAGLTPSGNPDAAGASQYMASLHALFASKYVEARMPDVARGTPSTRTGLIIPSDCYPENVSEWTRQLNYWESSVSTAAILRASRRVPKAFTLTSVSAYLLGPSHSAYPPDNFPTLTVYRARMTSGSIEMLAQATMAPASQSAYETFGLWTMDVDPVGVFYEDYDYLVFTFASEYGANAEAGTRFYGGTIYGTTDRGRVL